jgi:hypothetical protein
MVVQYSLSLIDKMPTTIGLKPDDKECIVGDRNPRTRKDQLKKSYAEGNKATAFATAALQAAAPVTKSLRGTPTMQATRENH